MRLWIVPRAIVTAPKIGIGARHAPAGHPLILMDLGCLWAWFSAAYG